MSGPVQSPDKLPRWSRQGLLKVPHAPTSGGYDQYIAARKTRNYGRANGTISNATYKWPLFITDINIDFSVQGSIAQSQLTRDFYPHNFVQPAFTVTGISLDNVDYGDMCDFIHMCQHSMIQQFSESNLIQLQIAQRGIPGIDPDDNSESPLGTKLQKADRSASRKVQSISANGTNVQTKYNQSIRGVHKEIKATGVVGSIQRVHQAGVQNPTWSFQFQVYRMLQGPYHEAPTKAGSGNFKTWVDLLDAGLAEPGSISTTSQMKKQNTALLKKTLKDSANIFNTTSGHGSYTPGGQSSGSDPSTAGTGATKAGGGSINSSLLNANQNGFASALSQASGLDPNVVAAWVLSEEPKSESIAPNGANNWLNIGDTGSGNYGGTDNVWSTPTSGGQFTYKWMTGQALPGYGTAVAGIQAVLSTAGKSPQTQISAIQNSGWANGYPQLPGAYQEILAAN